MAEYYRVILAIHVMAIISWMAGILYLYRLLIYASEQGRDNKQIFSLLSTMSRRLYRYITVPAMIISWLAGLTMVSIQPTLGYQKWFLVKFICVLLLTFSTIYAGKLVKRYSETDLVMPTSKRLRVMNEFPTLLMIIIVVMVIIKPF